MTTPISQQDKDRIEKAAKDFAEGTGTWYSCKLHAAQVNRESEAQHWQSIVSTQKLAIEELVKGLEDALSFIHEEFSPKARGRIKMLISKYKQL